MDDHTGASSDEVTDQAVPRYIRHLATRKLATTTVTTVEQTLGRLATWCSPIPPARLKHQALAEWHAHLAVHLQASSLRTQLTYISGFYRWCHAEGLIDDNPMARLGRPVEPRRLPRPMPEESFLLAYTQAAGDPRLRATLALARWAGLRACEIAGLDWSEVALDVDEPFVRVRGKGGHERVVDVAPRLAVTLLELPYRRGPVVSRRDGRPGHASPNRLSQVVGIHLRGLGIDDTLHALRHSFGTALYEVCRDIRVVQEAMGHASPRTSALYVRVTRANVRAAVLAAAARRPAGQYQQLQLPDTIAG